MTNLQDSAGTIVAVTLFLILAILSATFGLAYAIYYLLALSGFRLSVDLPVALRVAGVVIVVAGVATEWDVTKHRRPGEVIVSTYDTLMKLIKRRPIGERTRRTEAFVPNGPYAYTRNPMYLGVVTIVFGLGLSYSSTPLLLWGVVVTSWFWFVLIPFEEKELRALFGESYVRYQRQVPMLFPDGKRYRQGNAEP